mmetsp:Transcript_2081/g.4783  ORF Transcript_2081/g.4783 Transcript_2081/m.4783 type:complete len:439 (-) Transcript_2081:54-1370(-)|eukprot:CAMPEP_0114550372 /NCGR_PEP_ID=MMETSP0114-20121206/6040_1 /TAXON_ID=31324 /ORGANISM="Goniomonas sp, Strain m" /LENGTH=438 /DNA_ID=CAMNT_0001735145 /DNA_START=19 /DNA_END=1335 /DNA_ORIENTATION=-
MAEAFPGISKIKYNPDPASRNPMEFHHYNADEVVGGKTMKEHLRFSVVYWHTFRGLGVDPFGGPTILRPWEDGTDSVENAIRRVSVAFEFFTKLGVEYFAFHDRDIAPEGATLAETNANLDKVVEAIRIKMKETGIKLLWGTANMFSARRFMNGAATNPDAHVFACAAAQVKKAMEVTHSLGGENYVFWGGREGYMSLLNSDVRRELDHYAALCRMAVDYKKKLGFTGTLLIEPKPREPTKHQYDYDAQTVMGFLHQYGLQDEFKLNIEPNHTTLAGHCNEHDILMASVYGKLGSIDSNRGDPLLGWDTDQFPMDVYDTTRIMQIVLQQGGIAPGGLNFDCKVRRESTDLEDMFISHIAAMDAFALGLRNAVKIAEDQTIPRLISERYSSYDSGLGKQIEDGKATLEDCEKFILEHGDPATTSGKQEKHEMLFHSFLR